MTGRVHSVAAPDPPSGLGPYDYADAFVLDLEEPDDRPTEEWLRVGLEQAPRVLRTFVRAVWRAVLGFRLAPEGAPDHILGWRVVVNEHDATVLETSSSIMRGVLVARRTAPTRATLATYLEYRRPALARVLWTVIGPAHRALAPILLTRAGRAS